jgi:hypothetical protein
MESPYDVDNFSDDSFTNSILVLKDQQKEYELQEKFAEAEKTQLKIDKLKERKKKTEIKRLRSVQKSERQSINSIFKSEIKLFTLKWDKKIKNSLETFKKQEEDLEKKHKKQYNTEKSLIEKNAPCYFKPSAQLLNLIKCKEKAVLAKKYNEAQKIAKEIEEALEYEKINYVSQRQAKINNQLSLFQKKIDKEIEVLKLKHDTEIRELYKQKDLERENMEKKVENISRELENAQNIQVNIAKGLHTTYAGRRTPQKASLSLRSEYSTPQKLSTHKKSFRS